MTPFQSGKSAYQNGEPVEGNPYNIKEHVPIDDYPGRYQAWRQGWLNAKYTHDHDSKRERND